MKRLKKIGLLTTLTTVLILAACSGETTNRSSNSDVITLKVADSLPTSNDLSKEGIVYWMNQVEELSDGRVTFTHYPAEQLGKAKNMLDLTKNKITDVSYIGVGYIPDKLPLSGVGELPNAASSSVEATKAYWKVVQDILLEEEFLKNDVRPLFAAVLPPYKVMTVDKAVDSIDDLKGLKLRSGGGTQSFVLSSLGTTPVSMSASDTYTALERKTIDGVIFPSTSVKPYQLEQIVDYITGNSHFGSFIALYSINEDVWQSLPDDIKEIMNEASEKSMEHLSTHLDQLDKELEEDFKASGVEFVNFDKQGIDELNQVTNESWENWAKELDRRGLAGTEVKEAFEAALGKNNE